MTKTIPTKKVEDCCQGVGIVVHTNYVEKRIFVGNFPIIKVGSHSSKYANSKYMGNWRAYSKACIGSCGALSKDLELISLTLTLTDST